MRINIKTKKPLKDKEIKALYIISYAIGLISKDMVKPTLEFFADKIGYRLINKINYPH